MTNYYYYYYYYYYGVTVQNLSIDYLHVEGEGTEPITDDKLMSSP